MTLNLIETLKTSIYSPKHTENMKIHIIVYFLSNIHILQTSMLKKTALYADLYGIIYIVEGHTA